MHDLKVHMQEIVDSTQAVSEASTQNEEAVTEIVEKNENMQNVAENVSTITETNLENAKQIGDVVGQFRL